MSEAPLMENDLRGTDLYREAADLYSAFLAPGTGQICDAANVAAAPDGERAVFAGTLVDSIEGSLPTRICQVDLRSGDIRVLTFGSNTDRLPKYSPDGRLVAFLSDRQKAGNFQLYVLDPTRGISQAAALVDGWVEYFHWSPDGRQILLGVAGHGADVSGGQGAISSKRVRNDLPPWMPEVAVGGESHCWRRAWIYTVGANRATQLPFAECNVWEAVWCGSMAVAVVASPGPAEGHWYSACLHIVDTDTGSNRKIYTPRDQLGWPNASPSGRHLAVVEAICSDRWFVAGDLRLIDTRSGEVQDVNTNGVDITYTEWQSDSRLLVAGHRSLETVVGTYNIASRMFVETWSGRDVSTGGNYATVSGFGDAGDCVLLTESFDQAPEIAVVRHGEYRRVKSLDAGYHDQAKIMDAVKPVSWKAPDGLEIHGLLLLPKTSGPHPLVMVVHGGPVWHWRPFWLGRRGAFVLMLLKRGYGFFFPNPRGSSGRGYSFTRLVLGDMGGADTFDFLSGLDHLVDMGIADPKRLGVTGGSYGGFMTAWLATQDPRFAAAVALAPTTNQVTQHLISNIPQFVSLFLADSYTNLGGKYYQRSPIIHARNVRTPMLNICGALDRGTPPAEAVQFHNALLENGAKSSLIIYPEEGHGVRTFPAAIDYAARVVGWFEAHMGA